MGFHILQHITLPLLAPPIQSVQAPLVIIVYNSITGCTARQTMVRRVAELTLALSTLTTILYFLNTTNQISACAPGYGRSSLRCYNKHSQNCCQGKMLYILCRTIHRMTLTSLMFTVAKAILEVLTVLQELNVIRSALLLLCLELQQ